MPSVSKDQERFMKIAANNAKFATKAHISQKVAKEFEGADQAQSAETREEKPQRKNVKNMIKQRYQT